MAATDTHNRADARHQPDEHFAATALLLLAVGLVLRVIGAWWYRHDMNPDFGIVGLMAKHMAAGENFPVFFYGQPYMGTAEPAFSAVIAAIFGISGFTVCLGTALIGALLLVVVHRWAQTALTPVGALCALAVCLIGPAGFFQYMVSPRGGYALVLVAGTGVLWLTAALAAREAEGAQPSSWQYAILGLVAGLGWWTSQLIAPALITAAALYLLVCPRRVLARRVLWAPLMFLLGSAPFWVWNIRNGWETFTYMSALARTPFLEGLELWGEERLPHMLGTIALPHKLRTTVEIMYLLLVTAAIVETVLTWRRHGGRHHRTLALLAAWLFVAVSCATAAPSFFISLNTSRYLLPLMPAFAVLLAAGTTRLHRHLPWGLGVLPLVLVMGHHLWQFPTHGRRAGLNAALQPRIEKLARDLDANNVKTVYAPFAQHTLNFHLRERFGFTDMKWERYKPYTRRAELDQRPAFLNNYGYIRQFLAATSTTCGYGGAEHLGICFDAEPPPDATPLPPDAWTAVTPSTNATSYAALTDGRADTAWRTDGESVLRIDFTQAVEVCGLRLLCPREGRPERLRLAVRGPTDTGWQDLDLPDTCTGFYWSGTRPYWEGRAPRIDRRFPPRTVTAIRARIVAPGGRTARITELAILKPVRRARPTPAAAVDELLAVLDRLNCRNVYADRWLANRLHAWMGADIATFLEPEVAVAAQVPNLPDTLRLTTDTALVVEAGDAQTTRGVLKQGGIAMHTTAVPPWVVFHFGGEAAWMPAYASATNHLWWGVAPLGR